MRRPPRSMRDPGSPSSGAATSPAPSAGSRSAARTRAACVVVERTVRRSRSLLVKCGVGQFKQPFTRIELRLDLVPAKEPESAIADLGCRKAERLPGVQRSRVEYKIRQLARVTGVVF